MTQEHPPLKILIIEDEADLAELIAEAVSSYCPSRGMNVDVHTNPAEAMGAIFGQSLDAIFLDLHMPNINGKKVLEIIREKSPLNKTTPVIIVSGMIEMIHEGENEPDFENVYFIEKPVEAEKLQRVTQILLAPKSVMA